MATKKKVNTNTETQEEIQNVDVREKDQAVEIQEEAVCCVGEAQSIPQFDENESASPNYGFHGAKYTGDEEIVNQVNACAKKGLELANKLFENAMKATSNSSVINENQIKNVNLAIELFNAFKY